MSRIARLSSFARRLASSAAVVAIVLATAGTAQADPYYNSRTRANDTNGSYQSYYYRNEPSSQQQASSYQSYEPASGSSSGMGDWDVTIGGGLMVAPRYMGSEHYEVKPYPNVSVMYKRTYFLNQEGLGMNVLNSKTLKAGPVLGYRLGRDSDDGKLLHRMGDIAPSLNLGGFFTYDYSSFRFAGNFKHTLTHWSSYGLTSTWSAAYRGQINQDIDFSAGPDVTFVDGDYMYTWFGVTSGQAAASGLRFYKPDGGLRDAGLKANVNYHYTQNVTFNTFLGWTRLLGDAKDSPIVESANQITWGLGASYKF